jgi:parallel beta-helix repeat protein
MVIRHARPSPSTGSSPPGRRRVWFPLVAVVVAVAVLGTAGVRWLSPAGSTPVTAPAPVDICDSPLLEGPSTPPAGAVVVEPGDDLAEITTRSPRGTTFWLAAGTHTLGPGEFAQVIPKDRNIYLGAPGAVVDGQGRNRYAFAQRARDVVIEHLTIQGFQAPNNEAVVNHDAGEGWVVRRNTIQGNAGAGVMIGDSNTVEDNCLRDNGQYGFTSYEPDGVVDIVLRGNEITGNNTDDWESRQPGCGCTGGGKLWNTEGATIVDNHIHDNDSVGLWVDGNGSNILIEGNHIADNSAQGIFYEQSYNARIVDNRLVRNGHGEGPSNPGFPTGAIYVSEAGGDVRAPGGQTQLEISGNVLADNWSGVILWENADRFAGSPANTSTGLTTMVNPSATVSACSDPDVVETDPYYDDCRWKTQNVTVSDNVFRFDPSEIPGCEPGVNGCGFNGIFANWGSYPDWSPYMGDVVQQAITFEQGNAFSGNTYEGPWVFLAVDQGNVITWDEWTTEPVAQDAGSVYDGQPNPSAAGSAAGTRPTSRSTASASPARAPVTFPVAASGRSLVDARGRAWFAVGDAPWSLVGQLTDDEITGYLEDRATKGFRLVMFSAPEMHYADNAPRTISGDAPFVGTAFQSALNEPYWARVDHAIQEAERLGLTVLLTPAYLGCCDDGVLPELTEADDKDAYDYGFALGQRYRHRPNLMWLAGHDRAPSATERDRYLALQRGIRDAGDTHLWLPGGRPDEVGSRAWGVGADVVDVDTAYDYAFTPVSRVREAWDASSLPVVYIEGSYENERTADHTRTTQGWELRYQAWGAFTAGALAHIYGNNPMWHLNSLPEGGRWEDHLDDPGAVDMGHLADVLARYDWSRTEPDWSETVLVDGRGAGRDEAGVRLSPDLALVYLPTARPVTLGLGGLTGERATITRIDPSSGDARILSTNATGTVRLDAQGTNADGDTDWALLVQPS